MYPIFSLLLLFFISPCLTLASEDYEELLTVRPLRDGRVATRFLFTISQLDASHEMHNDQSMRLYHENAIEMLNQTPAYSSTLCLTTSHIRTSVTRLLGHGGTLKS